MVLCAAGCGDQTLQHAKPNRRYKLGENAFRDLKAGCGRLSLHAHLQPSLNRRSPLHLLQTAVLRVEGEEHPPLPPWGLLAHPSGTLSCSGSSGARSLIPWSPCPLISLAKALRCIWSDCNFSIVVAWANQTQFPAIQSPALLPNEGYFPAKLHLSNHSQFSCRAAKEKRSERFKKKKRFSPLYRIQKQLS